MGLGEAAILVAAFSLVTWKAYMTPWRWAVFLFLYSFGALFLNNPLIRTTSDPTLRVRPGRILVAWLLGLILLGLVTLGVFIGVSLV